METIYESNWTSVELNSKCCRKPISYFVCRSRGSLSPKKAATESMHRSRPERGCGQTSLSAAVSVRCSVWISSVMAYLMVIVQSGDSPSSRLHAGVSGVWIGGDCEGTRAKGGGRGLLQGRRDFLISSRFVTRHMDVLSVISIKGGK